MGTLLWLVGLGFMGFAIYGLGKGDPIENDKQRWLSKYFGEQGRQNWLRNEYLVFCLTDYDLAYTYWLAAKSPTSGFTYNKYQKASRVFEECKKKYGYDCFKLLHRSNNGELSGLVWGFSRIDRFTSGNIDAPWSPLYTTCRRTPLWGDWVSAGFQKPFMYEGKRVDPVKRYVIEEKGDIR